MSETIETLDDLVKTTVYELPDGNRITKSVQKQDASDPDDKAETHYWESIPPSNLSLQDETVKSFMEFLILNPAIVCKKEIEKGLYPDRFEFKVQFAPLNDPNHERTVPLSLIGYLDENQETGFSLEFTPELPITDVLKSIFNSAHKRIKSTGLVRILTEEQFEELKKNGKEVKSNID